MAEIYIVTHTKKEKGANPGLTPRGEKQATELITYLPGEISAVISGTAKRHKETAEAMGLELTTPPTSIFGNGDSAESIDGEMMAILENGTLIPIKQYTALSDNASTAVLALLKLQHNSVVVSGRPLGIMLENVRQKEAEEKRTECFSVEMLNKEINFSDASIYQVTVEDGVITGYQTVKELGEFDPALQEK